MIRTLSLIRRRDDLDRDAFRDHYESVHVPLALPLLVGLEHYVRYHVIAIRVGEFAHDVLTAFGYRDREAADAVFAAVGGEAGRALREDERSFMDKPANVFFTVSERLLVPGDEAQASLFVLARRPPNTSRFDASRRLVRDHWPALLAGFGAVDRALLRDAFPVDRGALPWDGVLQVCSASTAGLGAWAAEMRAEGWKIAAVETRASETKMPPADPR